MEGYPKDQMFVACIFQEVKKEEDSMKDCVDDERNSVARYALKKHWPTSVGIYLARYIDRMPEWKGIDTRLEKWNKRDLHKQSLREALFEKKRYEWVQNWEKMN